MLGLVCVCVCVCVCPRARACHGKHVLVFFGELGTSTSLSPRLSPSPVPHLVGGITAIPLPRLRPRPRPFPSLSLSLSPLALALAHTLALPLRRPYPLGRPYPPSYMRRERKRGGSELDREREGASERARQRESKKGDTPFLRLQRGRGG